MLTQRHQTEVTPKYKDTEFPYTIAQFANLANFSSNSTAKTFLAKNFLPGLHFSAIDKEVRLTALCFGIALTMRLANGKEANLSLLASIPAVVAITIEDSIKYQNELSAYGMNGLAPIATEKLCHSQMLW